MGIILGAGIYALVGEVAFRAGPALWVSFLLAALTAAAVGLCYAELASMFPRAGADYVYALRAFGPRASFVVGWLVVVSNLVGAAAVALAFGGYLGYFFGGEPRLVGALALVGATLIAFVGVREAVWVAVALTAAEVGGLVLVIAVGIPHLGDVGLASTGEQGLAGLLGGASLLVFAYVGFNEVASLAEETVDAPRVIPRAMLLSIAITTALYLAVALAAVSTLGADALARSDAPLADVVAEGLGGRADDVVAFIALCSTANTLVLILVAASRLIYGMADVDALPRFLAWVHPGVHTPARAIILALGVALAFVATGDLSLVAGASNVAILVAFASVGLAVIVLRYRSPGTARPFRIPGAVRGFPVVPALALGAVAVLFLNVERAALLVGGGLFVLGVAVSWALGLWHPVRPGASDGTTG